MNNNNLSEIRRQRGEQSNGALPPVVGKALAPLLAVPERQRDARVQGRRVFLEQARAVQSSVSPSLFARLKHWRLSRRKENTPMLVLARMALAFAIVIGGSGGTLFAAQASMPDDALYPVKLAVEDLRLMLTTDPQREFQLLMGMVDERFEEIRRLVQEDKPVGESVMTRLEQQLSFALRQAAGLGDDALEESMVQIRNLVQVQTQTMEQVRLQAPANTEGTLQSLNRIMAQLRVTAEEALENPTIFRLRHGENRPDDATGTPDNDSPGSNSPDSPGKAGGPEGPSDRQGPTQGSSPCPTTNEQGAPGPNGAPGPFGPSGGGH